MRMPIPFLISVGMLLTMAFLSIGLWSALPEGTQLPIRFNLGGNPVSLASAGLALSILPATMLFITIVLTVAPMLKQSPLKSPVLYACIWLSAILIMSAGHGLIIRHALFAMRS